MDQEARATAAKKMEEQTAADGVEIRKVLSLYAAAFDRKDLRLLKSVWPDLPEAALTQAFRAKGEIRSALNPVAPPELNGNTASIRCKRVTEQVTQFGRQKPVEEARTVRLRKDGGRWVISAID
jgi:hypothetical protein